MSRGLGTTQKKILLILSAGLALGFSRSLGDHCKIIESTADEWKKINQRSLKQAIKNLYRSRLVEWKENKDGSVTLILTEKGRNKSMTYNLDNLKIDKPKRWDKKWRVIVFDVPEIYRKARDSLRDHLKQMGFYELQKSVFIHPYPCDKVIDFLVEFYNIRKNVRQILAEDLDNSLDLKNSFDLL